MMLSTAPAAEAAASLTYLGDLLGPGLADMYPVDVASSDTSFFVLDAGRYRVVEVDRVTGAIVGQFGGHQGRSAGRIGAARALALDDAGYVYIADTAANRIVKLDPGLTFVKQWGTRGTGNGQFVRDYGVAVGPGLGSGGAPGEVVYVTDGSAGRVQTFTTDGTYLRTFGAGVVSKPRQLTVDPSTQFVYVISAAPKRVDVFDRAGNALFSFGAKGTGAGQFSQDPRGISIYQERAYVSDPGNDRIQVWNISSGTGSTYACSFGGGVLTDLRGISITPAGRLMATDEWGYGLEEFDVSGVAGSGCGAASNTRSLFGAPPPVPGVNSPRGMAVDAAGRVFVTDWWNQRIERVNADGSAPLAWGFRGTRKQAGSINFAWDVAIQPGTGNVFVANRESNEIEAFDPNGTYLGRYGKLGSGVGQFHFPQGVAFGPGGRLFVSDSANNRVQKCTVSLTTGPNTLTLSCVVFAGAGAMGTPTFKVPTGISVGADGSVWVADTANSRIVWWSIVTGTWTSITTPGGGTAFKLPWGVSEAPDGTIWVADTGHDRIVQMQTDGTQLAAYTGADVGAGAFDAPFDVAFSGSTVLVSDVWNNRVVRLG
jgi:DNA-binding beta-propeller fold protein YncE